MNVLERLAAQTGTLAKDMTSLSFEMVQAVAVVVERSINRQIGHDAPHHKVAGGGVGTTQRILSRTEHAAIMVKAQGPLHLLANPTQPHLILPKVGGSRRSRRSRLANYSGTATGSAPLRTPYGPRWAVHHPGTPGKDTWQHGVDEARPLVGKVMRDTVTVTLAKTFR